MPALLWKISKPPVSVVPRFLVMISFMAAKPAMTVASVVTRYSSADWALAVARIESELLVNSGRGVNDRVDGSCPLVQGPDYKIS